jgi:curved DNA-binding protein CbpA
MQQLTDPYRALGVGQTATEAEIKAAHRKLVKRYHPDTGTKSETDRFLRVQEAYRVLSDPLLRKEWDQSHAPGPVRADRTATPTPRRRRPPPPKPTAEPSESAPPRETEPKAQADARAQPRSSRSYTWSASEVPWWEEARTDKKQPPDAKGAPGPEPEPEPPSAEQPGDPDRPVFGQQDFDVYNRSSGAAWSMAARAYFRKGEAELPRRGSFRHEGTQVVTAGRARSAAAAEARRRAAAAASVAGAQQTFARATAAPGPREGTTHIVKRSIAAPWPSLVQRFGFALIAWLPIAVAVAFAASFSGDELMGLVLTAASLFMLVIFPRVAYIAALATLLVLVVGGLFIGGVLLAGWLPTTERLATYLGGMLVVGYIATAAVVVIGPSTLRPWSSR